MPRGYTLVEVVVAIFVFCIGGLALANTSAIIARALSADSRRERAARENANRLEIEMSHCAAGKLRC